MKPIFLNPDRDLENTTENVQRETTFCKVCMEVKNNYKSSCEISNVKSKKSFGRLCFLVGFQAGPILAYQLAISLF